MAKKKKRYTVKLDAGSPEDLREWLLSRKGAVKITVELDRGLLILKVIEDV